jgi:hypothetical protein
MKVLCCYLEVYLVNAAAECRIALGVSMSSPLQTVTLKNIDAREFDETEVSQ